MLTWAILVVILIIGISLLIIELIFVPGATIVGILGLLCITAGILYAFSTFGSSIGWGVTTVTLIISTLAIILSLKSGIWKRFALNQTISSKVNEHLPIKIKKGEIGTTLSVLRPIGNAEFGNNKMEVTTLGEFVNSESKVKVTHIEGRIIYVEQFK